jgi:predicted ATP-dependent protease
MQIILVDHIDQVLNMALQPTKHRDHISKRFSKKSKSTDTIVEETIREQEPESN